jgi:hypothetical protein
MDIGIAAGIGNLPGKEQPLPPAYQEHIDDAVFGVPFAVRTPEDVLRGLSIY